MMKCLWKGSLSLSLGLLASAAAAEEPQWRAVAPRPTAPIVASDSLAITAPQTPAALLDRPMVSKASEPARLDPQVQPVLFVGSASDKSQTITRGRSEEGPKPMPLGGPALTSNTDITKPPPLLQPEPLGPPRVMSSSPTVVSSGPALSSSFGETVVAGEDCCGDGCGGFWMWNREACGPTRRFYIGGEFLAWTFRRDKAPALVTTGPLSDVAAGFIPAALGSPHTAVLFGDSEYGQEPHYGGRFTVGYWLGDCQCLGFEGSFFSVGERNNTFTASSTGSTFLGRPFFDVNPDSFGPNVLYQGNPAVAGALLPQAGNVVINSSSRLWGAEVNLRSNLCRNCCWRLDILGGFRFLALDENLSIAENEVPLNTGSFEFSSLSDSFRTQNRFYGGQIGLESEFRWRRWTLDLSNKFAGGGVHQSVDIAGSTIIIERGGAVSSFPGSGLLVQSGNVGLHSRTQIGFANESGIKLGYNFSENIRLTVGYSFLYWTNVVRPARQIDTTVNSSQVANLGGGGLQGPNRPTFTFRDSDFWAQGVTVGLEFRY